MWQAILLKFALDFATKVVVKAVSKGNTNLIDVAKEEITKEIKNLPNTITDEVTKEERKRRRRERRDQR